MKKGSKEYFTVGEFAARFCLTYREPPMQDVPEMVAECEKLTDTQNEKKYQNPQSDVHRRAKVVHRYLKSILITVFKQRGLEK